MRYTTDLTDTEWRRKIKKSEYHLRSARVNHQRVGG